MSRVVISGNLHDDAMALLKSRSDIEIESLPDARPETFIERLPEADALILRTATLPAEALVNVRRLKVVARTGVGYDNVPLEVLTAKGIPVAIVGAIHSATVAEHALFLILALAKSALRHDAAVRRGDWESRSALEAFEVAGRTLLIIGFGRIGREVARRAAAIDMRVLAYDPMVPADDMASLGVTAVANWRTALPLADFVSLHVPRLPDTEGMIGATELAAMKPGAFLVNTARGGLVDEKALAAALASGHLAGAGLDTFEQEPPGDNPLFASDRVILSPHIAGLTRESARSISVVAAENALAAIDGNLDPLLVVNPTVLQVKKETSA